jgi:hypothetical protein
MTVRLTVAQALVRFLAAQYSERDGVRQRLIEGCWGIFGHGNVAGLGQALLQASQTGEADLKYYLARNRPRALLGELVGRARIADLRAGEHAAGPRGLRGGQARPATVPVRRKAEIYGCVLSSPALSSPA